MKLYLLFCTSNKLMYSGLPLFRQYKILIFVCNRSFDFNKASSKHATRLLAYQTWQGAAQNNNQVVSATTDNWPSRSTVSTFLFYFSIQGRWYVKTFFANDLNHLFWSAAHNEDSTQPFTFANKTYDLFGPVACKKDSPVKKPLYLANHTESVLQIIWMDQPLQRRMALYSGQQLGSMMH